MAEIEMDKLVKRYGKTVAVEDVSITVQDGEFLVLVGPSGCGKTTTLRMVAGLERISAGEIRIAGRRVNELAPKDRDLAMVFQSYALYSHFDVRGNLAFALRAHKVPTEEIDRRVDKVAGLLGLTELLDRKPRQMSGGQRQRVALGRAIIREPQAFLMDEPLSNLDAMLRLQMRKELIELTRELGSTVIYVTHDQTEAMTMGHRIAVMKDGWVQQLDSPEAVYAAPANRFVAEFIGTPPMNLVEMEVSDAALVVDDVRLDAPRGIDWPDSRRVLVGVRPEDLVVSDTGRGFPAKVSVVEYLGSDLLVYADAGGTPMSFVVPARQRLRGGDVVELWTDADHMHFFDVDTGQRLPTR